MVLRERRDAALTSRAVQGRPNAFAVLYERHHQALYRYCRSIVGHDEDARDAVQNAMTSAFAALQNEERDFELKPWLFRIAHNEAISLLRRRGDVAALDEAGELGCDSLQQAVDDRADLAQLGADLRQLSERQRSALVLRELSGLTHGEIATVLETTPRAVKQVIFEARRALQELHEGRAMNCGAVCRALSDGDGRIRRSRRLRAHLRACDGCAAFSAGLRHRPAQLAAIAPALPLGAATALAATVLPGNAAAVGAGAGAGTAGSAGAAASGGLLAAAGGKLAVGTVIAGIAAGGVAVAPGVVHIGPSREPARQERSVSTTAARRAAAVPIARPATETIAAERLAARRRTAATVTDAARPAATGRRSGASSQIRHTPKHARHHRTLARARRRARTGSRSSGATGGTVRPTAAARANKAPKSSVAMKTTRISSTAVAPAAKTPKPPVKAPKPEAKAAKPVTAPSQPVVAGPSPTSEHGPAGKDD